MLIPGHLVKFVVNWTWMLTTAIGEFDASTISDAHIHRATTSAHVGCILTWLAPVKAKMGAVLSIACGLIAFLVNRIFAKGDGSGMERGWAVSGVDISCLLCCKHVFN